MKGRINPYFAIFIITIFGSAITLFIVRVALANTLSIIANSDSANYASLLK